MSKGIDKEWIFEIIDKTTEFQKQLITNHFNNHPEYSENEQITKLKEIITALEELNEMKMFLHEITVEKAVDICYKIDNLKKQAGL